MILILKQFSISIYIDIELDIENGLNQILILILKPISISIYIDIELDIENGLNQILILILKLISISIYIDIDIEPQNPILPNSGVHFMANNLRIDLTEEDENK